MEAPVRLTIAPDPRHLRLARLAASSLAADLDYAVRDIDDLKVAIDELCAVLLVDATGPLELAFAPGPEGLVVEGSAPTSATVFIMPSMMHGRARDVPSRYSPS